MSVTKTKSELSFLLSEKGIHAYEDSTIKKWGPPAGIVDEKTFLKLFNEKTLEHEKPFRLNRYVAFDIPLNMEEHRVVVLEFPPTKCNIKVNKNVFPINLPYVQFVVHLQQYNNNTKYALSHVFVGCTTTPIKTIDDTFYELPLPNIDHREICYGSIKTPPKDDNPYNLAMKIANTFFLMEGNDDYASELDPIPNGPSSLAEWSILSTKNPSYSLGLKYQDPRKIKDFIND